MVRTKISGLVAFVALALQVSVHATIVPRHLEVHEKREALHPRWTKRDRVESHKLLPMRIGLTQNNLDAGHDYLMKM